MTRVIQCATCAFEYIAIEALQKLWTTQDTFNTNYLRYQDAARRYKCADYLGAWES